MSIFRKNYKVEVYIKDNDEKTIENLVKELNVKEIDYSVTGWGCRRHIRFTLPHMDMYINMMHNKGITHIVTM